MKPPMKPYQFGRPCFVYVAKCGEYSKVGIALDTEKRLSGLRTGCPYPIEMIARRQFPSEEVARGVEQMIHLALETQAHRGEWFTDGPLNPTTILLEQYREARKFYKELPPVDDVMASAQRPPPAFELSELGLA